MARRGLPQLNLGMIDRLRLGWRLLRDPRVPAWPKLVAPIVTALYVLSPVDVIPDFLLGLGQLDDAGMIALALAAISMLTRWAPREIVAQHAAALGLADEPFESAPYEARAGSRRGAGKGAKDEPIEAEYWIDDWR